VDTPCVTVRTETEWQETVDCGWNTLVAANPDRIRAAVESFDRPKSKPSLYGDGTAASRIAEILMTDVST